MFSRRQFKAPTQIPTGKYYLVINVGSSSVKVVVFDVTTLKPVASAQAKLIGQTNASITTRLIRDAHDKTDRQPLKNIEQAVSRLIDWVDTVTPLTEIAAVGHRLVHGGTEYSTPVVVTDSVYKELQTLIPFDPAHMTDQLSTLAQLAHRMPHSAQVACFDTAFHHDMPAIAQLISLPKQYRDLGIRRYGFHGLSYTFVRSRIAELDGDAAMRGRIIIAHLGSGASLVALKDGRSIDTTMGFTTNSGITMSTRTGDVDAGIPLYLQQNAGVSPEHFNRIAATESGLLGISGKTSDMYELVMSAVGDPAAAAAVEAFCYHARKAIGGLATTMGGLDMLVFTGGIGEKSAPIRSMICQDLEFLGIKLENDEPDDNGLLSGPTNPVKVRVIPTNEELVIARHIQQLQT